MTSHQADTPKTLNPIVLIDFDLVLHDGCMKEGEPIQVPGKPIPGSIVWLARLTEDQDRPNQVRPVIYSRFSGLKGGRQAMKNWMFNHGFPGSLLGDLTFAITKPEAIMTIDAKAFRFEGEFPNAKTIRGTQLWSDPNRAYYWAGTELVQAYLISPENFNSDRFPHWLHSIRHVQKDQYSVAVDYCTWTAQMNYYLVKRPNGEYYSVGKEEFNLTHIPSYVDEAHLHIARLDSAKQMYQINPNEHTLKLLLDVVQTVTNRLG